MPGALSYPLDASSTEYRDTEDLFAKEYNERAKRFGTAWKYYDGDMPKPLAKDKGDSVDDNIILAKIGQITDKIVSFMFGDGIRFDAGADDNDESTGESQVQALWTANRQQITLHNIALGGALEGHVFVRLEPRTGQMPKITMLNPAHCSVFWSLEDIDRRLWYRLQYRIGDKGTGKRIDYVQGLFNQDKSVILMTPDDPWWEFVYTTEAGDINWKLQDKPTKLPWSFSPVVDWQNMPRPHAYYGADDVNPAIKLNLALNLLASMYSRILKHHASPKTIGTGFTAETLIESSIGGFYTVSSPDAKVYNLEMQSDLNSAREFMKILDSEIWSAVRMLDPQAIRDTVGQLTNFGLRVLYTDAIRKTDTKRLLYAEGFEEITKRALAMAGKSIPAKVAVIWPDTLPSNSAEQIASDLEELGAGVIDKKTYRERHGYDNDKIEARLKEEQQDSSQNNDVQRARTVARAMSDFALTGSPPGGNNDG